MSNSWRILSSTTKEKLLFPRLVRPLQFPWMRRTRLSLLYAAILLCFPPTFADSIKASLLKKPNKRLGRLKLAANTTSPVHIFVDGERHHNKNKRLCGTGKYAIFGNRQEGDMMSLPSLPLGASLSCLVQPLPPHLPWDRPDLLRWNNKSFFSQIMALMLVKSRGRVG